VELDDLIERIFEQGFNGELAHPLALGQMVDILIDFWEADGNTTTTPLSCHLFPKSSTV